MTLISQPVLPIELCSITLVGNLVADPEIRYQANPVLPIADITVATHSRWLDKSSNSYKEWTSFHPIKVVGSIVEQVLLNAKKGEVILLQGYLTNNRDATKELLIANFVQLFAKGYSQEINQIQCSGRLISPVQLNVTENDKTFAEVMITTHQQVISPITQQKQKITIERPVHLWGNQAKYLHEHAQIGDHLIIDGKLNYLKNAKKSQFIDAKQVVLLKQPQ